jgi:hypothetical protein
MASAISLRLTVYVPKTVPVSVPTTDTEDVSVTEVSAVATVAALITVTDTDAVSVTEVSSVFTQTNVPVTDTVGVNFSTETTANSLATLIVDTLDISLAEASAIVQTKTLVDELDISIDELIHSFTGLSDSLNVSLTEAASIFDASYYRNYLNDFD